MNGGCSEQNTPLILASREGHLQEVDELLKHSQLNVNAKNHVGATALIIATQRGHSEVVRKLLMDPKVDANVKITMIARPLPRQV